MSQTRHLEIAADLDNLKQVRDFIEVSTQSAGLNLERTGELLLAVDEAVTNIIMHGCPGGGCAIELKFQGNSDACTIRIRDNAKLFDLTAMPASNLDTPALECDARGGFGVYLFEHLVDRTSYRTTQTVAMN